MFYCQFCFSQRDSTPTAPFLIVTSDSIENNIVNPKTDTFNLENKGTIIIKSDSSKVQTTVGPDTIRGKNGEYTIVKIDSVKHIDSVSLRNKDDESEIKDKITYKAKDSIVYDITAKKMYLYNGAETHYQKIQLNADKVDFDWTTMIMGAEGRDSADKVLGKPIFVDDGKEYRATKMLYNFKNSRGKVFEVSTSEGDAYLHSEAVKRNDELAWWGYKSKYTTCNLDHPHFYFKAKKIKLIPGKIIVTGPANLWIADIPTPIYIPFAIFPIKQGRRSGLIIPKYGSDAANGFFLRDGGYYWAASNNLGAKLTASIYTNGSFDIKPSLQYKVNYKYSGSLALAFVRTRPPDPDLPGVSAINDFQFKWAFQLDPKAAPTHSFNASVNVSTANFNNANRVTDGNTLFSTALSSNINYSKSFTTAPFLSLTISASHYQNLQNRSINITLPQVAFNVNRVAPFKAKISSAKPKWYENIGISYSFRAQATINTIDSLLLKPNFYKNLMYGAEHAITLDAPFTLFKYFNVTPSANYNERWYFQTNNDTWINKDQVITLPGFTIPNHGFAGYLKQDTVLGFKAARDFSASLSIGTKVTGIFKFKNKYLKTIRHIFTPQIGGGYHPDFGAPFWGYYGNARQNLFDPAPTQYSHFSVVNGLGYGVPPIGKYGAITWGLNNSFDIKIFSKKDTINHEKKIEGLLRVNISGGYNFAADSLKLQNFAINGTMRFLDNLSSSFSLMFDPYARGINGGDINTFYWQTNHELLRFVNAGVSLNATIHGKPKPYTLPPLSKAQRMVADYVTYSADDFYDFDIPWNLGASYSLNLSNQFQPYTKRDSLVFTQYVTVNGDLNLTPHWKIAYNTGFDFAAKKLTLTHFKVVRNLHCWELSFDWTAWPLDHQQFVIELKVLNPTLQDLKLTKKKTQYNY